MEIRIFPTLFKMPLFGFNCLIKFAHGLVMLCDRIIDYVLELRSAYFKIERKKKNYLCAICDHVIVFSGFTIFLT